LNITLKTYGREAEAYRSLTGYDIPEAMKDWLDRAADGLPATKVFELGSAHGRDAIYLKRFHSLEVSCSDAVPEFVTMLSELGLPAESWNAEVDELPEGYALYLANAVLLHFRRELTQRVLADAYRKLPSEGRFAFTLKRGVGEGELKQKLTGSRHFTFWSPEDVRSAVAVAGFERLELREHGEWLHCIAVKDPSKRPVTLFEQARQRMKRNS